MNLNVHRILNYHYNIPQSNKVFIQVSDGRSGSINQGMLEVKLKTSQMYERSIVYKSTKVWNKLPLEIRICTSMQKFMYDLAQLIIGKRNDDFVFFN